MKIRLMSFNTQHCLNYKEQKIDFEIMANAIKILGADIIGLQEMRGKGKRADYINQTARLAKLVGYKHYYFAKAIDVGGENPYGNAILSKYPIICAETVAIPDPVPQPEEGETRCILKAIIDVGKPLTVLATHFGLSPEEQQNAVDTVLLQLKSEKCVLMGDFNVTPDNQVLSKIRDKLLDTAEFFGGEKLSFPSDNPTIKIDYMFASKDLNVLSADIPAVVASDHRPYVCDIEI